MNAIIKKIKAKQDSDKAVSDEAKARLDRIYQGATQKGKALIDDESDYQSGCWPRRSGKTFAATSKALYIGEEVPGSRILIISLTLKSTKENYWSRSPGGLFAQNKIYSLGLEFNYTDCVWYHPNGSTGKLAGAETRADIEYLRGATAEADFVVIDECKSFAPALLMDLIINVIRPGLMTRGGKLLMIGTPGSIPAGPFFEATYPEYKNDLGLLTCIEYKGKSLPQGSSAYSFHKASIQDNTAKPWQWKRALEDKKRAGWDDLHPVWRREYLGEWVTDVSELVYAFARMKATKSELVTWSPTPAEYNIPGLPLDKGPWHLIMGLDFGYEDDNAIVLAAYSDTIKELRHIDDFKKNHLDIDQFAEEIWYFFKKYGVPEVVVGDAGALAKMVVESMNNRYGLGIIRAEKKEKFDHIELINSDFLTGRIKIIPDSDLDHELCGLQWDLSKTTKNQKIDTKTLLIRTGKLKEDPSCPNHLSDCLLYLWRYCYHYWAEPEKKLIDKTDPEWYSSQEKEAIARFKQKMLTEKTVDKLQQLHNQNRMNFDDLIEGDSLWTL